MQKKVIWFLLISILIFSSCNLSAFTKRPQNNSNGNKEGILNVDTFDATTPVEGLRPYIGLNTNKIKISWNKKSGANSYTVERAMYDSVIRPDISDDIKKTDFVNSLQFETMANTVTEPYFLDEITASSSRRKDVYYVYRVYANSLTNDKVSIPSDIVLGTFLSTPSDVTATKGTDSATITISFTQTPGSSKYRLYKNTINSFSENLEPIQTTSHISTQAKNDFKYNVSEDEKGKDIYFAVKVLSSDPNTQTEYSTSTKGYTRIEGAPATPEVKVNSGESKESIRVSFTDVSASSYQILRSKNGGGESILVDSSEEGVEFQKDENGSFYYDDDNTSPNTKYVYSVIAKNDKGSSAAGISENAYILSPPYNISAIPTNDSKFGYKLGITSPIGYDTNENLSYVVKATTKDGNSETKEISHSEKPISPTWPFYAVDKTKETDDEIRRIEVWTKNTKTSNTSDSVFVNIQGIPEVVSSFSASKNVYDDSIGAKNGIYPIVLNWISNGSDRYVIERFDSVSLEKNATFDVSGSRYNDKDIEIGRKYNYRIYAEDALGRNKGFKEAKDAYGAITASQFAAEFERHCAKPWEFQEYHPDYANGASKGGIWGLIRNEGTGSLGSASATDSYLGGTVTYSAKMSGFGGQLKFTYTPGFGEMPYIHFATEEEAKNYLDDSGKAISIQTPQGYDSWVGMSGDGDYTPWNNQCFYVSGWYGNNIIDASGISTKSKKLSGIFKVTMNYNTLSGETIKKEGVATPLQRGKVN